MEFAVEGSLVWRVDSHPPLLLKPTNSRRSLVVSGGGIDGCGGGGCGGCGGGRKRGLSLSLLSGGRRKGGGGEGEGEEGAIDNSHMIKLHGWREISRREKEELEQKEEEEEEVEEVEEVCN